ncbi:ribosome recycling factor [Trichocladium antarcticum]|uniref:Ribosome recycling factor n=1 Tax=Trichocladium antarcticum TaxID=1450529 RepID=A0AAN6UGE6_9PEZI|nr:ribosome recycling factor [Trichocladium antarcticum]
MKYLRAANTLLRHNAATKLSLPRTASSLAVQNPLRPTTTCRLASRTLAVRPFSHTATWQKKKGKHGSKDAAHTTSTSTTTSAASSSSNASGGAGAGEQDPFDLTDVTDAFERADKRYMEELKKLRSGGRFNADGIGAIPVLVDKHSAQTFPLRELATVAPLGGRRWSILAFEEDSVKAIVSAVQRSDEFNQQPQRSDENPLELTMTVEPERAEALVKRAKDVCQAWRTRVRDEAHRRTEMNKKWKAEGVLLDDGFHGLKTKLQKLQDERMKVILAKEKEAVQQITARGS